MNISKKDVRSSFWSRLKNAVAKFKGVLLIIVAVLVILVSIPFLSSLDMRDPLNFVFIGAVFIILSILVIIFIGDGKSSEYYFYDQEISISNVNDNEVKGSSFDGQENSISDINENEFSNYSVVDKSKFFDYLKDKFNSDILDDIKKNKQMERIFRISINRLNTEISRNRTVGITHLFFGILITLVGLFVLTFFVFNTPIIESASDWDVLVYYFVPRLSLVLLIEFFAYFFLRLYRDSVDKINYFQNELTNIEWKFSGLLLALDMDDKKCKMDSAMVLLATDRNLSIRESGSQRIKEISALIDDLKDIVKSFRASKQ